MAKARPGYARLLYHGTAGSTAATQVTHAQDVNVNITHERWETTDRGDGSAVPKVTHQVVATAAAPTFSIIYRDGDSPTNALLAAAETGADIAIKMVNYTGGDTEFDGDVTLDCDKPGGLKEGQIITFTCFPSQDSARSWSF